MKNKTIPDSNRLTISAIAELLSCTRKTARVHLHRDGAPPRGTDGLYDRTLALRFLRGSISKGGAGGSQLEQLRVRRLQIEIERAELELARSRGEVFERASIRPALQMMVSEFQEGLYERFTRQAPVRCVGKNITEVTLLLQDHCDQLVHQWRTAGNRIAQAPAIPAASGKGGYGS